MKNYRFKEIIVFSVLILFSFNLQIFAADELTSLYPKIDQLLQRVAEYNYGSDRTALVTFDSVLNRTLDFPQMKVAVELKILDQLQADIEDGAKAYYAEKLCVVGSEASLPVLQKMLQEESTFDVALYALIGMPAKEANEILAKSLSQFAGEQKIGIIQALGTRKDKKFLKYLYGLLKSDPEIARAAIISIGQIASYKSIPKLQRISKKFEGNLLAVSQDAILQCAKNLKSQKKKEKVYQSVYENAVQPSIKLAAAKCRVLLDPQKSESRILQILDEKDEDLHCYAIAMLRDIPNANESVWKDRLLTLSSSDQIVLLNVIADKKWQKTLPEVLALLKSDNRKLRLEALSVIARTGDASCVMPVAKHAASGKDRKEAEKTLAFIPGEAVSASIQKNLMNSEENMQVILINALAERHVFSAVTDIKKYLRSDSRKIRTAATYAMGELALHADIPLLIHNLLKDPGTSEKRMIEKAIYAIAQRSDNYPVTEKYVLSVLQPDMDIEARQSLLELIGKLGESKGLSVLKEHLNHEDPDIQLAVIRGLSNWPDAKVASDLMEIVKSQKNNKFQIIALRGVVRLMAQDDVMADSVKMANYQSILSIEHQPAEIRLIISGVSKLKTLDAIDLIEPYLTTETYHTESEFAIMTLIKPRWWRNVNKSKYYLERLVESENTDIKKQAQKILDEMDT